jgi:hypothetical protein
MLWPRASGAAEATPSAGRSSAKNANTETRKEPRITHSELRRLVWKHLNSRDIPVPEEPKALKLDLAYSSRSAGYGLSISWSELELVPVEEG